MKPKENNVFNIILDKIITEQNKIFDKAIHSEIELSSLFASKNDFLSKFTQ